MVALQSCAAPRLGLLGAFSFRNFFFAVTRLRASLTVSLTPIQGGPLYCGVEQLVARQAHNLEAEGSSPSPAIQYEDRAPVGTDPSACWTAYRQGRGVAA